jgi:uncharacterized membrane protein YkgB
MQKNPMQDTKAMFNRIDRRVSAWMSKYGLLLLRLSIGIVFFWFGILKFFPGLSPAQDLAIRTIDLLSFGLVQEKSRCIFLPPGKCLSELAC